LLFSIIFARDHFAYHNGSFRLYFASSNATRIVFYAILTNTLHKLLTFAFLKKTPIGKIVFLPIGVTSLK